LILFNAFGDLQTIDSLYLLALFPESLVGTYFVSKTIYVLTGWRVLLTLSAWDSQYLGHCGGFVRRLTTGVLVALFAILFMQVPANGGPASSASAALGVVVSAENSNLGAGVTTSGATVYDGDHLQTPANSTLRVRLGSGQMVLRQSTTADVHAFPNGYSANLVNGTVVVSSPVGQTFQLIADGATVRPASSQATSGQISIISPTELVLTGIRGPMEVSMGDEVKTVEAGSSYRLEVEPDEAEPGPAGQSPRPTGRNHFILILIPLIAAVAGIIIWRALISPTAP
jgi:hypothetical protein